MDVQIFQFKDRRMHLAYWITFVRRFRTIYEQQCVGKGKVSYVFQKVCVQQGRSLWSVKVCIPPSGCCIVDTRAKTLAKAQRPISRPVLNGASLCRRDLCVAKEMPTTVCVAYAAVCVSMCFVAPGPGAGHKNTQKSHHHQLTRCLLIIVTSTFGLFDTLCHVWTIALALGINRAGCRL